MIKKRTPRDYKFIRLIGEGSFSSVYLAVDADTGSRCQLSTDAAARPSDTHDNITSSTLIELQHKLPARTKVRKYAVKVCQKSHIKRQGKQVAIMREKEIMNILNQYPNEHFIRLYCTFQDVERLFFVMSYAENGELLTYMLKHPLSLDAVRRFTLQLVSALEHLHKLNIVHRDLKPENILLGEHLNILISDFGSAQIYNNMVAESAGPVQQPASRITAQSSGTHATQSTSNAQSNHIVTNNGSATTAATTTTTARATTEALAPANNRDATYNNNTSDRRNSFVGTAQYVSPEMLSERRASNKSDLWAFGVIIYQMVTNIMPFDAPNEYLIYKKIQSLDYTFPDDFDTDARDLISSLVKIEPMSRLGAHDDLRTEGYKSIRMQRFLADVTGENPHAEVGLTNGGSLDDPDLRDLNKIMPGLDETQLLSQKKPCCSHKKSCNVMFNSRENQSHCQRTFNQVRESAKCGPRQLPKNNICDLARRIY